MLGSTLTGVLGMAAQARAAELVLVLALEAPELVLVLELVGVQEVAQVMQDNRCCCCTTWRDLCCKYRLNRQTGNFHNHLRFPKHSNNSWGQLLLKQPKLQDTPTSWWQF